MGASLYWWVIVTAFAVQLYCDFSGYSDIARGLAKWMGYDFMVNFNHPYIATSRRDFWSRWHISLFSWFRDYLYIPLGGARWRSDVNMWITMTVSGLWHGAAWNFVSTATPRLMSCLPTYTCHVSCVGSNQPQLRTCSCELWTMISLGSRNNSTMTAGLPPTRSLSTYHPP